MSASRLRRLAAVLLAALLAACPAVSAQAQAQAQGGGAVPTPAEAAAGSSQDGGGKPAEEDSDERSSAARKLWRPMDALNPGLPEPETPLALATPRAALGNFMDAAERRDYVRAANVLDLGFLREDRQAGRGPVLARQLHYLLDRKVGIDWREIPDRRDGARPDAGSGNTGAPEPRRYIEVVELMLDGRPVAVQLERVKPAGAEPVWIFPSSTVEAVPGLYDEHGPGILQRQMPRLLTDNTVIGVPVWEWISLIVFAAFCFFLGWLIRTVLSRFWWRPSEAAWTEGLTRHVSTPLILLASLLVFKALIGSLLSLTGPILRVIDEVTLALIVLAGTWLAIRLVVHFADKFGTPFLSRSESEHDPEARRRLTQISVGKRIAIFIVIIAGIGMGLSYYEGSATVGLSFLFSAGAFSIILGIAAQSVLSNILSGIQIAVTEPVRIGDNVVFEGDWGWVEEITYTYVTIRTWDKRRVVIPHTYFLSKPVENWSKVAPQMIMPIYLYADYRLPVDKLRKKLGEILEGKKDWDRSSPPALYVTNVSAEAMEVRALVSARDPLTAWYLHAEVREDLMAYLQGLENGRYLPRRRIQPTDAEGSVLGLAPGGSDSDPVRGGGSGRRLTEEEKAAAVGDPEATGEPTPEKDHDDEDADADADRAGDDEAPAQRKTGSDR
ncbi:mechanosensitive ion channel family protein [Caenispirillum salinarum]|uniref:mechanosensitive ion channel family protein n=1 Tax=Caenispirillum salinarum TaxID=859058 RepID=UPI00384DDD47